MRTHRLGGGARAILVGAASLAFFACGEESTQDTGSCQSSEEPRLAEESTLPRQGSVRVRDTVDEREASAGQRGQITASFFDLSAQTATIAKVMPLSEYCGGILSLPDSSGAQALSVGALSIDPSADGTLDIPETKAGSGRYVVVRPNSLLPDADALTATATAGSFPAFGLSAPIPAPVGLTAPTQGGEIDAGGMELSWAAGGGDFVEIELTPDERAAGQVGGQVICQVADTGCYSLPASVFVFLLQSGSPTYTLTVRRRIVRTKELSADTALQLETATEHRITLTPEDG